MKLTRSLPKLSLAGAAALGLFLARPGTLSAQNLYVSNLTVSTISQITPGGVVSTFASSGLSDPTGVAFDAAGNLFVANYGNSSIEKITPGGQASVFASSGLSNPGGMAFDAAGNLYVSNYTSASIEKFTPGGVASVFSSSPFLGSTFAVAFDAVGNLFVASYGNNTIVKITPGGVASVFASGLSEPVGLAFDRTGNLYVADQSNNRIEEFTPGGLASTFATSGLNSPRGLAFDLAGNLFVANAGNSTIEEFTPGGQGTVFDNHGLDSPEFLAFNNVSLPIPEPSTWALLLGGAGLLAWGRFRRWLGRLASMRRALALIVVTGPVALLASAKAATFTVPEDSNIYGAGHAAAPQPGGGGAGELPQLYSFNVGQFSVFNFTNVTGSASTTGSGGSYAGPDGNGGSTSISAYGGISGTQAPGTGFLVGVFETNTEPADPAPPTLSYTTIGTSFTTLAPLLDQVFFIGDGLTGTGTGSLQNFVVPAGATRLYLGIPDSLSYDGAPGYYGDNYGSFSVTVTSAVPEPSTWVLLLGGAVLLVALRRRARVVIPVVFAAAFLGGGMASAQAATPIPLTSSQFSGTNASFSGDTIGGNPPPYGYTNNTNDSGWIWNPNDYFTVNFNAPTDVSEFRVWSVYTGGTRGANWEVFGSSDGSTFAPVTTFTYAIYNGGGVNADGSSRTDTAGWYEFDFNAANTAYQYWKIEDVGTTNDHSPRSAQVEFYGNAAPEPSTWALLLGGAVLMLLASRHRRALAGVFLLAALAVFSGHANAQTVGVQFYELGPSGNSGSPLDPSQTAGVIPQSNYNIVTVGYGDTDQNTTYTGTTGPLLANGGTSTGITLTHTSHDSYNTNTDATTANGNLLHFEDKTGGNKGGVDLSAVYTFSGLTTTAAYNLFAYIACDFGVYANLTVGATTYYVIDAVPGGGTPAFVNASNTDPNHRVTGNYVEFLGLVPNSNGQITLTNTGIEGTGNNTAAIDGLQLQAVIPEPSAWTTVLGGAGLLVAGQRFRRVRKM